MSVKMSIQNLTDSEKEEFLLHYGKKGMKWRKRKKRKLTPEQMQALARQRMLRAKMNRDEEYTKKSLSGSKRLPIKPKKKKLTTATAKSKHKPKPKSTSELNKNKKTITRKIKKVGSKRVSPKAKKTLAQHFFDFLRSFFGG